ncbi:MAG: hypothetical protein AB8I08_01915 [Sandaracinaceae bacterium]
MNDEVGDEEVSRVARVRAENLRRLISEPEPEPTESTTSPALAAMTATPGLVERAPTRPEDDLSWVPWVVAGGGFLIALSAVAPAVLAVSDSEQLDRLCASGRCEGDYEAVQDRGYARALAADLLMGIGVTVAVGGIVAAVILLLTADGSGSADVACDTQGCRLQRGVVW